MVVTFNVIAVRILYSLTDSTRFHLFWSHSNQFVIATVLVATVWVVTACGPTPTAVPSATPTAASAQTTGHSSVATVAPAAVAEQRDPNVPALPFPDNPDPLQCGIPEVWNSDTPAWLTGSYQGRLIEPTVFLYDSHARNHITGMGPTARRFASSSPRPTRCSISIWSGRLA